MSAAHKLAYVIQAFIFYLFLGHLIAARDFMSFPFYKLLYVVTIAGLAFQFLYLKNRFMWSGLGVLVAYIGLYYVNPFVSFVSYGIFALFFMCYLFFNSHYFSSSDKAILRKAFIIFLAIHYFLSGYYKMTSPDWNLGSNLQIIFSSPLSRDWFRVFVSDFQESQLLLWLQKSVYWTEMGAVLMIFSRLRKPILIFLFLFHLVLVMSLSLLQLTIPYFIMLYWIFLTETSQSDSLNNQTAVVTTKT